MSIEKLMGVGFKQETVNINGETIIIKEMNGGQATKYQASLYKVDGKGNVRMKLENTTARLLLYTVHDSQGNIMFKDTDIELINKLPKSVIDQLFSAAIKINGLRPNGVDVDVDSAEKN